MNDAPPIQPEPTWAETDPPSMEIDEPATEVDEPAMEVDEPATEVDEPAMDIDEPAMEIDEPPIETEPLPTPPADTPGPTEPERRRISDYHGDVSRLEVLLETERRQNEELRAEVQYQRRRIEREEEARLQLMQLLDNSQRLLRNAQPHTQHLLG